MHATETSISRRSNRRAAGSDRPAFAISLGLIDDLAVGVEMDELAAILLVDSLLSGDAALGLVTGTPPNAHIELLLLDEIDRVVAVPLAVLHIGSGDKVLGVVLVGNRKVETLEEGSVSPPLLARDSRVFVEHVDLEPVVYR